MANASAKKTASQNDTTIKYLQMGLLTSTLLSLFLRLVFRTGSLSPARLSFWLHMLSHIPSVIITKYLVKIGTPKRDAAGTLISSGEDLSSTGMMEWCFDIVYITWVAQISSAAFGEWAWWFYGIIPAYAGFKIWNMFLGPYLGFGKGSSPELSEDTAASETGSTSKRQEKLRKRQEKGDSRVQSRAVKR